MKKIICLILALASVCVLFAACGKDVKKEIASSVTDEQREEHIKNLIGNNVIIAENIAKVSIEVDSLTGTETEYTTYTWTVNPDYSSVMGNRGTTASSKSPDGIDTMTLITENDKFALYMDVSYKNAGDFALVDKTTGHTYHSNPTITSSKYSNVKFSATEIANPMISAMTIEAYDISNKRYEFNTRDDCLADLNLKIVRTGENSVRVIYTIGKDPDKDLVPTVITESTWSWIIDRLSRRSDGDIYIDDIEYNYKHITPQTVTIEEKEALVKYFPTIETDAMYIARGMTTRQRQLVKDAMQAAGFTVEMLKKEMEKVEYSGPARAVMYTIPVDLILDEEGLRVDVDTSLILAPSKQKLYKIYLYKSFGSYTPNEKLSSDQYIIVPDGSGAVIPARGALTMDPYSERVYGDDKTFQADLLTGSSAQVLSPFLIFDRSDIGGLLAVVESGAAQTYVTARPANTSSNPGACINFDMIYTERDYRTYAGGQGSTSSSSSSSGDSDSETSSASSGIVLSKEEPKVLFTVRYIPTQGNKTYSEYASVYRDYLIRHGKLSSVAKADSTTPFILELIGSVNKTESSAGVPTDKQKALTSYADIKVIVDKLEEAGIKNIDIRYTAWSNGGYYNSINDKLRLLKVLGSEKELSDLTDYLKSLNIGFYTDADFLYVYKDETFDSLNYTQDTARRLDMRIGRLYKRNYASGQTETDAANIRTILAPDLIAKIAATYKTSLEKVVDTKQISFGEIGKDINSNYKTGRITNRTDALAYQLEAIGLFTGYEKLFTTGNDYVWAEATHIINMPMGSSDYMSSSYSIPFIQMLLHGYVNYTGTAVTRNSDYTDALLLCLETGSGLSVNWMAADNSIFDNTELVDMYSMNYEDSFDRVVELYKKVSAVLDKVSTLPITNHEYVDAYRTQPAVDDEGNIAVGADAQIAATTYGDKYIVYVNYSSRDYCLADGTVIPAEGYVEVTK